MAVSGAETETGAATVALAALVASPPSHVPTWEVVVMMMAVRIVRVGGGRASSIVSLSCSEGCTQRVLR